MICLWCQRIWVWPISADTYKTADVDLSAQSGVDCHATSLRKPRDHHTLWINRIFFRDLLEVKDYICHSQLAVNPGICSRKERLGGLRGKHQPAFLTRRFPIFEIRLFVSTATMQRNQQGIPARRW